MKRNKLFPYNKINFNRKRYKVKKIKCSWDCDIKKNENK